MFVVPTLNLAWLNAAGHRERTKLKQCLTNLPAPSETASFKGSCERRMLQVCVRWDGWWQMQTDNFGTALERGGDILTTSNSGGGFSWEG